MPPILANADDQNGCTSIQEKISGSGWIRSIGKMSGLHHHLSIMLPASLKPQDQSKMIWRRRDTRSWSVSAYSIEQPTADIQASVAESGLGVISWWNQGEQEEEMEEQVEQ